MMITKYCKKLTLLLKCYLSKPKFAKKTHTGSICCVSSYWGGVGCSVFTRFFVTYIPSFSRSISTWCYSANVGYGGLVAPNQARYQPCRMELGIVRRCYVALSRGVEPLPTYDASTTRRPTQGSAVDWYLIGGTTQSPPQTIRLVPMVLGEKLTPQELNLRYVSPVHTRRNRTYNAYHYYAPWGESNPQYHPRINRLRPLNQPAG